MRVDQVYLIESLHLLFRFHLSIRPHHPGRVSISDVAFISFLALEENLAFFAFKQTDVVNLENIFSDLGFEAY